MDEHIDEIKRAIVITQWGVFNDGSSMWPTQHTLLHTVLRWEANLSPGRSNILWLYMGERMGHTVLWKTLKKIYPEQYLFMVFIPQFFEASDCFEKLILGEDHKQFSNISKLKEKILIIDVGGPFIVTHDQILDYSSMFKGVIIS